MGLILSVDMENSVSRQPLSHPFTDTLTDTTEQPPANTTASHPLDPATDLIRCGECGFETDCPVRWQTHLNDHAAVPPRKYRCKQCSKMCSQKANLKSHIEQVHMRILHQCPVCQLNMSSKGNLKKHLQKTHAVNKGTNVTCEICNGQLRGDLARHQRTPKCKEAGSRLWASTGVATFLASLQFAVAEEPEDTGVETDTD
jgi:hypothetical protein